MNPLIYRPSLMAAHIQSELPDEMRSSFDDMVLALIAEETDDAVGAALRLLLDQTRELGGRPCSYRIAPAALRR